MRSVKLLNMLKKTLRQLSVYAGEDLHSRSLWGLKKKFTEKRFLEYWKQEISIPHHKIVGGLDDVFWCPFFELFPAYRINRWKRSAMRER